MLPDNEIDADAVREFVTLTISGGAGDGTRGADKKKRTRRKETEESKSQKATLLKARNDRQHMHGAATPGCLVVGSLIIVHGQPGS